MKRRRLVRMDLTGERLRLRPHRGEDGEAAFALLAGQDEILRWLVWDGPSSAEELCEHYRGECVADGRGTDLRLAIEESASGTLLGSLSLRTFGPGETGDLGYWIGLPYQGHGFGREALALAARLAFHHLGMTSLVAWVFVGNQPSRRVLEYTGFTLVRTAPGRVRKRGARVDEWHFVLLASEWRRLRAGFRPARETLEWREEAALSDPDFPPRPSTGG